jgi:hypothetical protein
VQANVGLHEIDGVRPPLLGAAWSAGLSWSPARLVQVGVVHHRSRKHSFSTSFSTDGRTFPSFLQVRPFRLPDRTGLGIAVRATDRARLAFDAVHIWYSQFNRDLVDAYAASDDASEAAQYRYPDATELHLGGEYLLPAGAATFAVRGGWWRDPKHAVIYSGSDRVAAARTPIADTVQDHATFGAGIVAGRWEVDAGFDVSRLSKRLTISLLGRF